MRKVLLAVATAVLGSAILAGGSAWADDDDRRYNRHKKRDALATGFTFCPAGNAAVFPATNIGRRPVGAWVSCVDDEGTQFTVAGSNPETSGPVRGMIEKDEPVVLSKSCEGELVRCTIRGRKKGLERLRGVLHICELDDDDNIVRCSLTEALTNSFDYDD